MGKDIVILSGFDYAVFIRRLNRFLVECDYNGKIVTAHLPNPGRLWELLQEGRTVYLKETQGNDIRNTNHTIIAVKKGSETVFLHTHYTNRLARILIEEDLIPGLEGYIIERPEYTLNNNRFDFLLNKDSNRLILEVKSCTLFHNNIAMFPDAVTSRGRRHLLGLAESSLPGGVLFIIHSNQPKYFLPEYHVDLEFSKTLYCLRSRISIWAVGIGWDRDLSVQKKVKALEIPWYIFEREGRDSGAYMLILELNTDKWISIGGLGDVFFKKGFYIYVGSSMKNLNKRLERHKRKGKKHFWHIDYLREEVDLLHTIPIRSHKRLECNLADSIKKLGCVNIPDFGASDCMCDSHLFYMERDPIHDSDFIEMLLDYRMPFIDA